MTAAQTLVLHVCASGLLIHVLALSSGTNRPPLALKMIVPKMRHENEKVNMLALTVS